MSTARRLNDASPKKATGEEQAADQGWFRRQWLKFLGGYASLLGCSTTRSNKDQLWLAGDLHLGHELSAPNRFLSQLPGQGFVNLEGPIAQGPGWSAGPNPSEVKLRNHPKAITWMTKSGILGATLLNNHQRDTGPTGTQKSASFLRAANLLPISSAQEPNSSQYGPWRLVSAYLGNHQSVGLSPDDLQTMAKYKTQGSTLVVSLHIDAPPSHLPSPRVRHAVQTLRASGADVIALHGSHVIGPLTRTKHCLIAWGLGNLSFACPCSQERLGLIVQLRRMPDQSIRAKIIPIAVGSPSHSVRPFDDPHSAFELLKALKSSPMKIRGAWAEI